MFDNFIITVKSLPRLKLTIICLAIWQYVSIVGMVIFGWPSALVWLNTGLLGSFLLLAPTYESLLLLILSIPFFVVIPNAFLDSLSMWRPLFLLLFIVWIYRSWALPNFGFRPIVWDKYLGYFLVWGLLITILFGQFKIPGFKLVLFWLNVYMLYIVTSATIKNKQQLTEIVRYVLWTLAIIVTLGFTQLFGTFFSNLDTFWVYWADNVARLYYGNSFAQVSLYSNSWFSYTGGRELRMFSIMPDSQSFAYICIFGVCLGTALTKSVFIHVRKWLWSGIRFAGLGLMLSGTRAAWVSMVIPFTLTALAFLKGFHKKVAKKFLWPFAIVFILFAISPIINKGLSYARLGSHFKENFFDRAKSILSTSEISNQGRIVIWKSSSVFAIRHPLGVGFGNFISSLTEGKKGSYDELSEGINKRYNLPQKYVSAHNLYLQILVETGVIGLGLFCAFLFFVLRTLWVFLKRYHSSDGFLIYFVAQALLSTIWICGAAFFDVTLFNDKVLMIFFLNLALSGFIVRHYEEMEKNV